MEKELWSDSLLFGDKLEIFIIGSDKNVFTTCIKILGAFTRKKKVFVTLAQPYQKRDEETQSSNSKWKKKPETKSLVN